MFESWIMEYAGDLQVALFFCLLAILALLEYFLPKRPGPMARKRRWRTNLFLTTINIVVLASLPVTFFAIAVWAQLHHLGLLNWVALPLAAAVILNLLGRAFISFFTHFLVHKVPVFWRVHRVHHFDTELDVSTTLRFHPLEFFVNLVVGLPLVIMLGLSPWMLLFYELFDASITVFAHANIRLPKWLNRWLCYVVVTPDLHRVHHSSRRPETDSNFGAVFPIWDLVFGTFRTRTQQAQEDMELGLEVRDGREGAISWLLRSPFLRQLNSQGLSSGTERIESIRANL